MLIYTTFCYRSLKFCKDFCCMAIYHVTSLPCIFSPIVFKHLFIAPIQLVPSRWNFFMDSSPVKRPTTSKTSCRIFYIGSDQNNTPRMISHSLMKCSWRPFLVLFRLDWCWQFFSNAVNEFVFRASFTFILIPDVLSFKLLLESWTIAAVSIVYIS